MQGTLAVPVSLAILFRAEALEAHVMVAIGAHLTVIAEPGAMLLALPAHVPDRTG